jgi:uncharacterized BrkB/YihY/UPF0761 family membrane protein
MNQPPTSPSAQDIRTRMSTLWIVVMFSMVFADILTFITPGTLRQIVEGTTEVKMNDDLLLAFAVLTEIPIAMIFLSRSLPRAANRWVSLGAVLVTAAYVLGGASFTWHYAFFAAVEVLCMAWIAVMALRWPKAERAAWT